MDNLSLFLLSWWTWFKSSDIFDESSDVLFLYQCTSEDKYLYFLFLIACPASSPATQWSAIDLASSTRALLFLNWLQSLHVWYLIKPQNNIKIWNDTRLIRCRHSVLSCIHCSHVVNFEQTLSSEHPPCSAMQQYACSGRVCHSVAVTAHVKVF